jgi:hypothetical protein
MRSPNERNFNKRDPLETSRWEKDRSILTDNSGRWQKNHRRSDATDETNRPGSLLSRMTKDGKPVVPVKGGSLASRMTRDGEPIETNHERWDSRNDSYGRLNSNNESYGRLKDDDSEPQENNFQEPVVTRGDLASRTTWSRNKGSNGRSREQQEGFSIRGAASTE